MAKTPTTTNKPASTSKKPAAKQTPANNAESGVVDDREAIPAGAETPDPGPIVYFSDSLSDGPRLPELDRFAGGENMVGPIADVLFASGYFPGMSPAQLAVKILVGRSLGFDDIAGPFDLVITPGPVVAFRPGTPLQNALEAAEVVRAANRTLNGIKNPAPDPATPKPAPATNPTAIARDELDAKTRLQAKETQTNVVAGEFSAKLPADPGDSANKGPLTIAEPETSLTPAPGPETTSAAEARPEATAIPEGQLPGKGDAWEPPVEPNEPAPGSATLDSALSTADAAASISDSSPEAVKSWRDGIDLMCADLGISATDRLQTFDESNLTEKHKMFVTAREYYDGKVDASRAFVIESLEGDGKLTPESQQGFFLYAEVSSDPLAWTFKEAQKAELAILKFLEPKAAPTT